MQKHENVQCPTLIHSIKKNSKYKKKTSVWIAHNKGKWCFKNSCFSYMQFLYLLVY